MNFPFARSLPPEQTWLRFLIVVLLVLGIFFRFCNLDRKVYWHDEVYTSMRAAGFTRQEIDREFQNQIIPAQDLQKYQRPKLGSTLADTIKSLAIEDPQHPPLYFLMARFWMQAFGDSLTASRALPALLSLLAFPFMYGLGLELFASKQAAWLATALLALSPFDILFAQTARQYTLLTVAVIGSSFLLLRARHLPSWRNWGLYTLANAFGLYVHPFFGLTLIAQGTYVLLLLIKGKQQEKESALSTFLAIAASLVLFSPWLVVLTTNSQRALATTSWTQSPVDFLYLVKLWLLSFTALFLDLDFGFDSVWTYLPRLAIVLLIATAIYKCRYTHRETWLFILTSIFVPFLMLVLPDLLLGGKRSAVSRYLISCYPGVQLAVAYLLTTKILHGRQFWRGITLLLFTGAIASCTVSAFADTWWSKDLSYSNAEVSRRVNATSAPVIISDLGDDYTNTGDLISLSYLLDDDVRLLLVSQPPDLNRLPQAATFVFRPSQELLSALEKEQGRLEQVSAAGQLWQINREKGKEASAP